MPILPAEKTEIAATLPRDDARDILLIRKLESNHTFRILTSSPRRREALVTHLPGLLGAKNVKLDFQVIRGNIQTRLAKLKNGEGDALVMAKAALDRVLLQDLPEFSSAKLQIRSLLENLNWIILPLRYFPCAPAQGALAMEVLRERADLKNMLSQLNDAATFRDVHREREILHQFGGGCSLAVGAYARSHPAGTIVIESGQVESAPRFERVYFQNALPLPKVYKAEAFQSIDFFAVTPESPQVDANVDALQIANPRIAARLRKQPRVLWSAGLATWHALAKKGFWVHGSDEGFGESTINPQIDHLFGAHGDAVSTKLHWQKLTHADATDKSAERAYRLVDSPLSTNVRERLATGDIFYWKSRKIFEKALSLRPDLLNQYHACGPGKTYRWLRAIVPKDRLYVFTDEKDFFQQILG